MLLQKPCHWFLQGIGFVERFGDIKQQWFGDGEVVDPGDLTPVFAFRKVECGDELEQIRIRFREVDGFRAEVFAEKLATPPEARIGLSAVIDVTLCGIAQRIGHLRFRRLDVEADLIDDAS
jgi:hypothetical protein